MFFVKKMRSQIVVRKAKYFTKRDSIRQYVYFSMAATQARPPNLSYPSRRDFFAFSYFLDGCAYPVHPPRAAGSLEKHSIFKSDLQIITNTK